ncbi:MULTISPECIES: hypothetical protein [Treponema]|uniref:hypothetical protein n=1 Tax=Treponema TaxID=157 RepID=UPI003FD6DEE5
MQIFNLGAFCFAKPACSALALSLQPLPSLHFIPFSPVAASGGAPYALPGKNLTNLKTGLKNYLVFATLFKLFFFTKDNAEMVE